MLFHALLALVSCCTPQEAPLVATWTLDTRQPFVGEVFALEFALEGASEFLTHEVVPRTLRRLERAVEFDSGFSGELERVFATASVAEDAVGPTCVLDGRVVRALRLELPDGRERLTLRLELCASVAGAAAPAPRIVYAARVARAVGVFGAEVTSDYDVYEMAVDAPTVDVRPLPPEADGLAVGVFELVTDAPSATRAAVGERIAIVAKVRGTENLEHVHVPRLACGGALHVLGVLEALTPSERVFTFDVEVLAAPTAPCEFVLETFEPNGAGRVASLRTPLPIAFAAPTPVDGSIALIAPFEDLEPPGGSGLEALVDEVVVACVVLVVGVLVGVAVLRARRARNVPDPVLERAHAARRAALERGDAGAALAAFVEALFEVPVAARSGAALREHLTRRGVPPELAARVGERVDAALHARYGGGGDANDATLDHELCAELERVARPNPRNER